MLLVGGVVYVSRSPTARSAGSIDCTVSYFFCLLSLVSRFSFGQELKVFAESFAISSLSGLSYLRMARRLTVPHRGALAQLLRQQQWQPQRFWYVALSISIYLIQLTLSLMT